MSEKDDARTHRLTGPLEQARGVIGRYPDPDEDYEFVFSRTRRRRFHMLGVPKPLRVRFYLDGEVQLDTVMRPWIGTAAARCDRVVESRPE